MPHFGAWGIGLFILPVTSPQSPVPSDALSLSKCPQSPVPSHQFPVPSPHTNIFKVSGKLALMFAICGKVIKSGEPNL
ncbi:MAG: hypothetical protein ACKPA7_11645 [Sphaerospermopsis kisseleviana]